ncbi:hypothetical protein [Paracoccus sp. S3-43]|uniref:hypothetical protein n=1 Tax=Paracoccus sp. S3-43 TaxID=3030011 RepID=UPI0023B0599D|nr:hypothetical protein [Paracoccus sp. S3-43]WEF25840.1 hypothetical protein PXD02_08025 [Paracoccus sp. S3-43]
MPLPDLSKLTESQIKWIEAMCGQFELESTNHREDDSDIIDETVLESISDLIKVHHAFSRQALSKDRFEYALEGAVKVSNRRAELAPRGNAGHDITIDNARFSLKTEAAAASKEDVIHISKIMELGKGDWTLEDLRDKMLAHMEKYERILVFRYLPKKEGKKDNQVVVAHRYELVEIPKELLMRAKTAQLIVCTDSKQNPQPGYGIVYGDDWTAPTEWSGLIVSASSAAGLLG